MRTRKVKEQDLKVGLLYKVTISDCCVGATFTSRLIEHEDLAFENGIVFDMSYGCEFEEVETEENPFF